MALTTTQVSELYVAIFNRASEKDGNAFWAAKSLTAAEIADAMLATSDAATYFGTSIDTNQAFIEHIYLNTLNKTYAQDTAGVDYWVALLDAGSTRGEVVAGLVTAAQDTANAGAAQDQFNNRVAVSNHTAATLATAPSDYATSLSFSSGLTVTSDSATVTTAKAAVDTLNVGSTFSLTTGFDSLTGGTGSDTFVGLLSGALATGSTAQPGDNLTGGDGNDTFNLYISGDAGAAFTLSGITLNSIETVGVSNFDTNAGATTVDMSTAFGATKAGLIGSAATGDTIFDAMSSVIEATAKGAGDLTFTYASTAVSGSTDDQKVTVDNFTGALTFSEVETVTITATGTKSTISTLTTDGGTQDATTLKILGDKELVITTDLNTNNAALTAIDASGATGKVTITTADADTNSIKLGSGDDTLVRNNQNNDTGTTDVYDGGAGTDTLKVTTGGNISSTNLAKYTNFEVLELTDNAGETAIDLSSVTMFTKVVNSDTTTGTSTINNVAAGTALAITVANGGDENTTMTLANNTAADSINVTVGGATASSATVAMGTLTLDNYETINIASSTTADNSIAALTSSGATKLVATGDKQLTITAFTSSAALKTIDASAMTGKFIMGATSAATAITVTGGTNDDTLIGGTGNDTLSGGEGKDTITLSSGNDTVNGGAGDDTIKMLFADLNSSDTINGGDGTDALEFTAAADADFTGSTTTLAGVSNIEKYTFSGLNGGDTVTLNDTVMNNGSITIEFTAAVTGNNAITTAAVLNTGNTVNFTDKSAAGTNTYTISNGIDNVDMGAVADIINVTTSVYLTATDTLKGGAGADVLQINIDGGATSATQVNVTAAQLAGVSGVETINIDDATATYIGITLSDAVVNANASSNAFAVSATDGTTAFAGLATIDASAVTATATLTLTGGTGVDTIKGGAGDDEILSGGGADKLYGTSGKDDFHVSNTTNTATIYDFTFGGTSSTTVDDQIQVDALFLGSATGADTNGDFTAAAKANDGTALVVDCSTGATGVLATTDVAIFDDVTYTAATLDTAIEALDSAVVTQDFFAIYQDGFGDVRIALVESDTGVDSGADFTVTDVFILSGVSLSGVKANIDIGDFIFA